MLASRRHDLGGLARWSAPCYLSLADTPLAMPRSNDNIASIASRASRTLVQASEPISLAVAWH